MIIRNLELFNFRHLCDQKIDFSNKINLFVGNNGQGKTSILEAVYLLSQGKSFRKAAPENFIKWGSLREECLVLGKINTPYGEKKIGYQSKNAKRAVFVNDNAVQRAKDFYGQFRAVSFTPDDLEVVKGPPSIRRKFLDRTLAMVDEEYVTAIVSFQKAIKNRNKILLSSSGDKQQIENLTSPWTEALIASGLIIAEKRALLVKQILENFSSYYNRLSNISAERVSLRLESSLLVEGELMEAQKLRDLYRSSFEKDLRRKSTNIGSHKDELEIEIDTGHGFKQARHIASQGQARSIALSLELSVVNFIVEKTSDTPVILLDDVESELDVTRKKELFLLLNGLASQVLITATDVSDSFRQSYKNAAIFDVNQGRIELRKVA